MAITTLPALPIGAFSALAQPVLTAENVTLRPWTIRDVDAVLQGYGDSSIQHWHVRSMTPAEARAWIEHWPGRWAQDSGAGWALEVGGEVAGQLSMRHVDLHEGRVEWSYWVLPAARGKGVATTALIAATEWVFSVGVHRAELDHSSRNEASCRVATKAGYLAEGTARQRGLHSDGWHDMHLHARLRSAVSVDA
ncbi:GNAT family N-acetyltransferase [Actinoplanes bogorensis]|uniref:GNAT family N-acetyltransferase n=1 Tax=Paractinoplanes bogorensis TaxID=1610840 RepID=A0ABS5YRN9_9ACTN|nr:GNAT family N-acetyltransferase [Actinoplanes bogorensis]MBU2666118.1 GNAT family N-acetyltransferase [Actinoplanes bogorensis]